MTDIEEKIRNGILSMQTRRRGSVAEIIVKKITGSHSGNSLRYDLSFKDDRIEVKSSAPVCNVDSIKITEQTALTCILNPFNSYPVSFYNFNNSHFDCNIQQIKPNEFDILFYVLFFSDCIVLFKMTKDHLKSNVKELKYSDKQHRGNVGEGQFHITERNLHYHLENYHFCTLQYEDLIYLLRNKNLEERAGIEPAPHLESGERLSKSSDLPMCKPFQSGGQGNRTLTGYFTGTL